MHRLLPGRVYLGLVDLRSGIRRKTAKCQLGLGLPVQGVAITSEGLAGINSCLDAELSESKVVRLACCYSAVWVCCCADMLLRWFYRWGELSLCSSYRCTVVIAALVLSLHWSYRCALPFVKC